MTTTNELQSDTPRTDAEAARQPLEDDEGRHVPGVPVEFARGIERELSRLRANLDRLTKFWEFARDHTLGLAESECRANRLIYDALLAAVHSVRRVLAGETPPEPGQSPATAAPTWPDLVGEGVFPEWPPPDRFVDPAAPPLSPTGGGPQSRRGESAGGPQ